MDSNKKIDKTRGNEKKKKEKSLWVREHGRLRRRALNI